MTSAENRIALEVHELLLNARPHADDDDLARAAELSKIDDPHPTSPRDNVRAAVSVAIWKLQECIESGASAADLERLLLDAIEAAERCVKRS